MADFAPVHPGEILQEEFMKPLGLSQYALAKALCVPQMRIHDIVHGKRGISPDTALRLARYFGTTPEFWLNLQMLWELETTRDKLGAEIEGCITPRTPEAA